MRAVLVVLDELAYLSATVDEAKQQKEFTTLLPDLVSGSRATRILMAAAPQWSPVPASVRRTPPVPIDSASEAVAGLRAGRQELCTDGPTQCPIVHADNQHVANRSRLTMGSESSAHH